MCARYAFFSGRMFADDFGLTVVPELEPRFNIAPTQIVPAIVREKGHRQLDFFKWGLVPSWAKDPSIGIKMINARSESVMEKPAFKAAFRRRRCLIPADGFFEWDGEGRTKQAYFIYRPDQKPFAMAGLWEEWESPDELIRSCTILTCEPNYLMSEINDRMPVILQDDAACEKWLATPEEDREFLNHLMVPCDDDFLTKRRVGREVGNPRNEGPEIIAEVGTSSLFDLD